MALDRVLGAKKKVLVRLRMQIGRYSDPSQQQKEQPMADEEMRMELERLRSENAALKHVSAKGLALKVSEKGALSVYGLGRFPVTLYKEQWVKLLAMAEEIKVFLKANDSQLKAKD